MSNNDNEVVVTREEAALALAEYAYRSGEGVDDLFHTYMSHFTNGDLEAEYAAIHDCEVEVVGDDIIPSSMYSAAQILKAVEDAGAKHKDNGAKEALLCVLESLKLSTLIEEGAKQ